MGKRKREKRKKDKWLILVRRKLPWRWRPPCPSHCGQLCSAAVPIRQLSAYLSAKHWISSKAIRLPGATGSEDNGDVMATRQALKARGHGSFL